MRAVSDPDLEIQRALVQGGALCGTVAAASCSFSRTLVSPGCYSCVPLPHGLVSGPRDTDPKDVSCLHRALLPVHVTASMGCMTAM